MSRDIRSSIRSTILPPAQTIRGTAPTLSVLLIGTSETGPTNEIVVPRSMVEAEKIFGSLGRGNLLEAYHEFILGSSRGSDLRTMVGLMRVDSGSYATLELPESTEGSGESSPEVPSVTAFTITAVYKDARSNDIRIGYRITDYGPAVVVTLPASMTDNGEATDYIFRTDLSGTDTTLINTLVDLQDAINSHATVGRYIRAEVNTINRQYSMFVNAGGAPATDFDTWTDGATYDASSGLTIDLATRFTNGGSDADTISATGSDILGDITNIDMLGNDNSSQTSAELLRSVDDITVFNHVFIASSTTHEMEAGVLSENPMVDLYAIDYTGFASYPILTLADYDDDGFKFSRPNYNREWGTGSGMFTLPGHFPASETYFNIDQILNPDGSSSGDTVIGSMAIPPDPFSSDFLDSDIFRWKVGDSVSKVDSAYSFVDGGRNLSGITGAKYFVPIKVFDANLITDHVGAINAFRIPDVVYDGGSNADPAEPSALSTDITRNFYNNGTGFSMESGKWYIYKVKGAASGYLNIAYLLKTLGDPGTGAGASFMLWETGTPSSWASVTPTFNFVTSSGTADIDVSSADDSDGYIYIAFKFDNTDGAQPIIWTSTLVFTVDSYTSLHEDNLAVLGNAYTYNMLLINGDNEIRFYYGNDGILQGYGTASPNFSEDNYATDLFDWTYNGGIIDNIGVASTKVEFATISNYNSHDFKIMYSVNGDDWYEISKSWNDSSNTSRRTFLARWIYNGQDDITDLTSPNQFSIQFIPDGSILAEGDETIIETQFPFLEATYDASSGVSIDIKSGYMFRVIGTSAKVLLKYTNGRSQLDKWNEYTIEDNKFYFAHAFNYKMNYNMFTAHKLSEGVDFSYDRSTSTILITNTDLLPSSSFKNILLQFDYDYEPEWFDTSVSYQMAGGSDGIDEMSSFNYYTYMESALDTLKVQAVFDIVVPKGAYIDETDYIYDPISGRRVEKNVGFFSLFDNFTQTVSTDSPMTFILSIKPFRPSGRVGYTASEITSWYNRLTDTSDTSANAIASLVGSTTNHDITVLAQPYRIPAPGGLTYISDGAAYIAGVASRLKYDSDSSLTSTLINSDLPNGVTPAFRIPYDYEDVLLNMRYLVSNVRDDGTYRIVRDYTLDDPRGALRHLTHVFVAQSLKHEMVTALKTFIGQTFNEKVKIAISSVIQNVLRPWMTNGVIIDAIPKIYWDQIDANIGIIPITLIITRSPIIQGATLDIVVK